MPGRFTRRSADSVALELVLVGRDRRFRIEVRNLGDERNPAAVEAGDDNPEPFVLPTLPGR